MSHSTSGKGTKKSNFTGVTSITGTDTLDFVRSSQNLKISYANFLSGLGVTGSITAVGNTSDSPVLDVQGSVNGIRNLQAGDGVSISITPDNSLAISTSFSFDQVGIPLVDDSTTDPIVFRSLVAGSSIDITEPFPGQIGIDVAAGAIAKADNVVIVNELADFPTPVSGVIELTNGTDIVYQVDAANIDISSNRFTATGGSCVIRGSSRFASRLEASTLSPLFTTTDCGFSLEFIGIDAVNTEFIVEYTSDASKSLVLNNIIVFNCRSVANVTGGFTTSMRTCTFVASSVGGVTWNGAAGVQVNMTNCLAIGWTGSLLDFGTATFSLIDIASNNRFISPVGTTIISGAASSANIDVGGRGVVEGSIFNGSGTALAGIDPQDLRWTFNGNIFADNITKNTKSSAKQFLSALTVAPTASAGSGVFVAIGGVNWTSTVANRWTFDTAGIGTYIGLSDMDFYITHKATGEPSSGGAIEMQTQLYISGAPQVETIGTSTSGTPTLIAGDGIFTVSNGDTIQLFAAVIGSVDIDFASAGVSVVEA